MFVICLHLVSPKIQCLALCWSEMRRCGSGHFQDTSNLHTRHLVYLLYGLFQQKGNRCAVMSTVDYSCNIARKSAPPQLRRTAALTGLLSILPDERLLGSQTEQLAASCSAPQTETQSDLSTPTSDPRYCCPSPSKHRERSAYAYQFQCRLTCSRPGGF